MLGGALALAASIAPVAAARAAAPEATWVLGCPREGTTSVAQVQGRPDATFTRVYRGAADSDGAVCVVEMTGRVLRMVRQVLREGSSLAEVMQPALTNMFPARAGQRVSATAFIRLEGSVPPVEQQFANTYTYIGQRTLQVGQQPRRVAVLVHREEGRTNSYAAESHYYFDVQTHELLRFEYRPERGVPRPIFSWHVRGVTP